MLSNQERAEGGLAVTLIMKRVVRILSITLLPLIMIAAFLNRDNPDLVTQVFGSILGLIVINCFILLMERLFRNLAS